MVVEEVARLGVPVRPNDLINKLGLPKPTIHRLMQTAEAEGFLQRDIDGLSYGPGDRLRLLAANTISSERIRTARLAIMRGAAEIIGETINLSLPEREGMIYIDRVETKWPLRIQLPIGTQVPFHCTASGKLYLASLKSATLNGVLGAKPFEKLTNQTITDPEILLEEIKTIRSQGHSTDNEEFMEGMTAIAVPVIDNQKRLIATLSVHAPKSRYTLDQLTSFLDSLKSAADKLSQLMA